MKFANSLVYIFAALMLSGCYHRANFRTADPNGSSESHDSTGAFSNDMSSETYSVSQMQSCMNRVGPIVEAEELCKQQIRRSMPGAYIMVYQPGTYYPVVVPNPY